MDPEGSIHPTIAVLLDGTGCLPGWKCLYHEGVERFPMVWGARHWCQPYGQVRHFNPEGQSGLFLSRYHLRLHSSSRSGTQEQQRETVTAFSKRTLRRYNDHGEKTVNLNVLWYFNSHFSFSLTSARSLIILSAVSKWNTPAITAQKLPTTEGNPRHSHCQTVCQPPFLSRFNGSHFRERHY